MARLTKADVLKKAEDLKNWGKWGPDDELGVLNYVTPEDIVNAAKLVRKGKVFRLGLNLDENGPQRGLFGGRWNPLHQMLATGTDAMAGKHDVTPGLRYADDAINLPTQAATQWDALSHVVPRRQDVERLSGLARRQPRSAQERHREVREQDGRPRRAARRGPPQGRRLSRRRVSPSRSPTSTRPRARRASRYDAPTS